MKKDFIELFWCLKDGEVSEDALYELIDEAHSLIQAQLRNPVPNTLRKFYECLLYNCRSEKNLIYKDNGDYIDVSKTSKKLFEKEPEVYKNTIRPFLTFVNNASHCYDADYAKIKKTELHKCIGYVIDIWNWYAQRIKNLDSKYLITEKYDLPEPIDFNSFKTKIESKEALIQDLKNKLAEASRQDEAALDTIGSEPVQNEPDEDDNAPLDIEILEQDIFKTVQDFIANDIYCTHKTIALFLLGDRIAQTDYKHLADYELFGKYSKNKFSAFEYDMALQNLILQEKIIQMDAYYHPCSKNMSSLEKWLIKFRTKLYLRINGRKEYKAKINQKYVNIIQKAIDEDKKIKIKYYKSQANTAKKEVSIRILRPIVMVPKDNQDEIYNSEIRRKHTENLYYLGAVDDKDNKLKTFRLDAIKNPMIIG